MHCHIAKGDIFSLCMYCNVYVQQYSERSHTIGAHAQINTSVMNQQDGVESSLLHGVRIRDINTLNQRDNPQKMTNF